MRPETRDKIRALLAEEFGHACREFRQRLCTREEFVTAVAELKRTGVTVGWEPDYRQAAYAAVRRARATRAGEPGGKAS